MEQKHIFVSYSSRNKSFVNRFHSDLDAADLLVWIDQEGLTAGTPNWEQALRHAIRDAYAFILIASPDSYESRYVQGELEVARMYGCPVFPVWADGENWGECVPLDLIKTQYVNMRDSNYSMGFEQLIRELRKIAPTSLTSEPIAKTSIDLSLPIGFEPRNPYKGLRAFTEYDREDYFGRETFISELLEAIRTSNFLAVVGPSGSGKSSLVMAGLIPRLRNGALPHSETWIYIDPIFPGVDPIESLSVALANALDSSVGSINDDLGRTNKGLHLTLRRISKQRNAKVVVFIDQFEELFTQTTDENTRRQFIDLLVNAITESGTYCVLVITLRADFYDRPMKYENLGKLIERHSKSVLPMSIEEMHQVIERPSQKKDVQIQFEANLVGDLLYEIHTESGALPLLQFALDQLFRKRNGHNITRRAYIEIGGVTGALALHAESVYLTLPSEQHRDMARHIFLRLIEPGIAEQGVTRRRAALRELLFDEQSRARVAEETISNFVNARLLTITKQMIEVSHEALIRQWERLSGWSNTYRDDIRIQYLLSANVTEWLSRNQSPDVLFRGPRLLEAREWATRNTPSADENAFLHSSFQAEKDELERIEIQQQVKKRFDALGIDVMFSFPQEIRTPLLTLLGFAEILAEPENDTDFMRDIANQMHVSAMRLQTIIDRFFIYLRILSTEIDPVQIENQRTQSVHRPEEIITIESQLVGKQYNRDTDIRFNLDPIEQVKISETDLRTIIHELIDNAFKFSKTNIIVSGKVENKFYVVLIKDFGRGMSTQRIEEQFAYIQYERQIYERQGMGLGLFIARRLAILYGGKLTINSVLDNYTEARVYLPS